MLFWDQWICHNHNYGVWQNHVYFPQFQSLSVMLSGPFESQIEIHKIMIDLTKSHTVVGEQQLLNTDNREIGL